MNLRSPNKDIEPMRRAAILAGFIAILAVGFLAGPVLAGGEDEASGVATRKGDASPSAADSKIDNYIRQDEQINIDGGKDAIVKVLRVNQKNLVNDYVVAVYPINHVSPKEIRSLFRMVTGKEGGRAEVIRDKVGKKAYLQVICPQFQLPYIEAALKALDEGWVQEDVDGSHETYYKAKFRDIADINDIAEVPGGSDGGTAVLDETANSVFYRGEPYRVEKYAETANAVDVFPPQLLLDVSVYEVELTNDLKLGLDYVAWKCGPGRNLFRCVTWGGSDVASGHYSGLNFLLTSEFMDFMVRKGRARLVTSGRLNVRNAEQGTLDVTDELLHFDIDPGETEQGAIEDSGYSYCSMADLLDERCIQHNGDVRIGMSLSVTPYIGLETTELVYGITMNDVVGATPSGTPMIRNNSVGGTVLVRDGIDVCVGGLKRTEDVKSTAKIPILGSIPVLGYLFGGEQNARHNTEMVIVLSPQIVQFSEVHKELAREEDKLVRAQVASEAVLPLPKTEYGFDMWLLGKD
jgi:hypothetical protein